MRDRRNADAGAVAPLTVAHRSRLSYPAKTTLFAGRQTEPLPRLRENCRRQFRQSISLTAQKRSEAEVVVKATEGGYVRYAASKSFNPDAQLHVTSNASQLPRQVS